MQSSPYQTRHLKLPKITIFFIVLMLMCTFSYAQKGASVIGKVVDKDGLPLPGVNLTATNLTDSNRAQSVASSAEGEYNFLNLKKGNYKLDASLMGFKTLTILFTLDSATLKLSPMVMQAEVVSLGQVEILSKRPLFEQKIDRMVVNVDAMISASGSSALEVLEKSPGVNVGQNGTISLKGKSVSIFIDGKPTYLSGADLENYLRSLPSSTLAQIELMTNPPAKYDAAGNGGVINILTKRTKIVGFNGGANISYIQGRHARTNNSVNLNYRNNKWNVSANLGYITTNSYSDLDINRYFENSIGEVSSTFLQKSARRNKGESATSQIATDFYVSEKTTIGLGLTGVYRPNTQTSNVNSQFFNSTNQLDSIISAANTEKSSFKNAGANLNFRHEFDKNGRELTSDIDYLNYNTSQDQTFVNDSYLPTGSLLASELLTGTLPTTIHIYSAKTDYSHPLKNGIKLEAGLKTNLTTADNAANYFTTVGGISTPDINKTNHFTYRENINAAYFNANKEFNKLTVQLGLRAEKTVSKGHQLANFQNPDSTFNRNYTNLFPTAYLQYKLDTAGNNLISVNYGRRIDRPYYQDLNPFLSPIDKFTYYTGNPFLTPSISNSFELSHTYKNKWTTTATYSKTLDQVNETIEIVNGIYYSRPGNIGQSTFKALSINGDLNPAKWLTINLFAQVANIHTRTLFYTGELDTEGTFVYLQPLIQFKLKHDWLLQADGYYQSKVTNAQFVAGEQKRMNIAVSKKFSASTTLKLVLNDVFHSYVNSGTINNLRQTRANYRGVLDTRTGVITLSYRFGKAISGQRKHEAGSAESEKNRVKN